MHIRPCIEVKAISRFCNQYCKLTGEARKQLQAIEGALKEVTARKSKLLRDAETLEGRVMRVAESVSSATYSLHA